MRTDYCGELCLADAGRQVAVCGWVARRREHGEHLAFVDVRDHTGIVQCVVDGGHELRSEWVVRVTGTVRPRPPGTANPELATGEVEVGDCAVEVLAEAAAPPFPVEERGPGPGEVDETLRLRYRYVDLRRERMQSNLRLRARVNSALRRAMEAQGFLEIETPLLIASTPEGARDFIVPSRLQPGSWYALPQSPQILKQLCMVGGFDRYYQIARCVRDEDLRADRQFEFTQLDAEVSFVGAEEVMRFISVAVSEATREVTGIEVDPSSLGGVGAFGRMPWREAIDRYGTDKPDVRFAMELVELTPVFAKTELRVLQAPCVKGIRVPGGASSLARNRLDDLTVRAKQWGAHGLVWVRVGEGGALESPVTRHLSTGEQGALVTSSGAGAGDLLLLVADEWASACAVLGRLRAELGRPTAASGDLRYVWVTEFPLFERGEDGRPTPAHHPFTMPEPADLGLLETNPLSARSLAYDLTVNGWELGSGSVRIHRPDIQRRVFAALGIGEEEATARFGFLLEAFRYGAPPHAGFAFGVDRLAAVLAGEENIREVIAYPKTQSGLDPLMGAPTPLSDVELAIYGLALRQPPGRVAGEA